MAPQNGPNKRGRKFQQYNCNYKSNYALGHVKLTEFNFLLCKFNSIFKKINTLLVQKQ